MKISTFLLLTITGIAGYGIWTQSSPKPTAAVDKDPQALAAANAPVRPRCQRSDLLVVHGKVLANRTDGLLVNITWPGYNPMPARLGNGAVILSHTDEMAAERDQKDYGHVMTFENGALNAATDVPEKRAEANTTGLLLGHPEESRLGPGSVINVVAVPVGSQVYSMRFELAPEANGSWMWRGHTALDHN